MHAGGDWGFDDDGGAKIAGEVAGFVVDVLAARVLGAAAEAVGQFVFAQKIRQALETLE